MGQSKPLLDRSILIVEDEALIRFELMDFFEDAGFRVFDAADADEAIPILERERAIRVVLTDVQMPGSLDGLKLAHYVRDRFPPTALIVTSGMLYLGQDDLPTDSLFVPKPINPRRVLSQIEQMMV